jgi:hypothetical protein
MMEVMWRAYVHLVRCCKDVEILIRDLSILEYLIVKQGGWTHYLEFRQILFYTAEFIGLFPAFGEIYK